MKNILILCAVLFSFNSVYAEAIIPEEINIMAKEIRRDLWISGHEEVQSKIIVVDRQELEEYTHEDSNDSYEEPLSDIAIEELFECLDDEGCNLYLITTSSEYWGGYGVEAAFVMMEPETNIFGSIHHEIYSE